MNRIQKQTLVFQTDTTSISVSDVITRLLTLAPEQLAPGQSRVWRNVLRARSAESATCVRALRTLHTATSWAALSPDIGALPGVSNNAVCSQAE